jgi:cyclic beta-1,2-glucan synthetase
MYRLIVEVLLGLEVEVDRMRLTPLLPEEWDSCVFHYRFHDTLYHIRIVRPPGEAIRRLRLDGIDIPGEWVQLHNDHREHHVELTLS